MNAPFSHAEFLEVFARYNDATWPVPLLLLVLAMVALAALYYRWPGDDRLVCAVVTALWAWAGIVFQFGFFVDLSAIGIAFGLLFLVQAAGMFRWGVIRHRVVFEPRLSTARGIGGALLIAYALWGYPLIAATHGWPRVPTFGAPCPVALFTFGLLFWSGPSLPRALLIAPLVWALVATSAAVQFDLYEDWALAPSAVAAALWLLPRRPRLTFAPGRRRAAVALSHRIWRPGSES